MSYTDDRPRRTRMSLPEGANGLERRVCDALDKNRDLLCQVLADDETLSPEEREQYEADLREIGDQYRALRESVYARYAE